MAPFDSETTKSVPFGPVCRSVANAKVAPEEQGLALGVVELADVVGHTVTEPGILHLNILAVAASG